MGGSQKRTVPREKCGLEAAGLADEDRGVRVVLLHGGIAALEEVPVALNINNLAPISISSLRPGASQSSCAWGLRCCGGGHTV